MEIISRFFKDFSQSYFLFGPRGTGKSTWLKKNYPNALYVDFLSPDVCRSFQARPERLKDLVKASDSPVVIIDEVQRMPDVLTVVHQMQGE